LEEVDFAARRHRLAEVLLVPDGDAVHERDDVVPQRPVFVGDVAAEGRVAGKRVVEGFADGAARDDARRLPGRRGRDGRQPAGQRRGDDDSRHGRPSRVGRR
jgi:hypothetical protein